MWVEMNNVGDEIMFIIMKFHSIRMQKKQPEL